VNRDLEQRLLALGAALEVPAAPDLVAGLPARLGERPPSRHTGRPAGRGRTLALAFAGLLALAGAAMAVPSSRHAVLRVLGLRGVRIERVQRLPPAGRPPRRSGKSSPGLGTRIPFASARRAAGFTALLPAHPVPAYLAHDVPGGRISLVIGRVFVTEFRGTGVPFAQKILGPNTRLTHVRVAHGPGAFLSGAPHEVLFATSTGSLESARVRLAGDVLIWQRGPVTLRMEGVHSLRQALALASSLGTGATARPAKTAGTAHRATTLASASPPGCPVSRPGGPRPPRVALLNFGDPIPADRTAGTGTRSPT
jgi:hypothetical protein